MKFIVTLYGKKRPSVVRVEAEYYTITPMGALAFKRSRGGNYPLPLRTFAAGAWRDVVTVEPAVELEEPSHGY